MLFGIVWILLSQAFATWRGWGADSAATLLAGCFLLCLRWQWIVLSRLGVALLNFVLVSWCVVCFWAPLLRPPRLLTQQLCGSGCVCRPEFSIIRLKNNSIYLKPDESFVYWGKSFDFMAPADSVRRLEMQNFGLPQFCASFGVFSCGVLPESGGVRTPAETLFTMERVKRVPTLWLQTTPQETARCARWCHWTVRFVWCPFFGLERHIEWLPKAVLPSSARRCLCHPSCLLWLLVSAELLKQLGAFRASCRNPKNRIATRSNAWIWRPFLVLPAIKIEIENSPEMALSKAKSGSA